VIFSDLRIFNKVVFPGDTINNRVILEKHISALSNLELSYKENVFSIDFASLHFTNTSNIRYSYMLEGFDNSWSYTDNQKPQVTYTNLSGGKYVLKVKATNCDGVWNEKPSSLIITITPPFWKTLWFRIATVFLMMILVLIIIRWQLKVKEKEFKTRSLEQEKEIIRLRNEMLNKELEEQKLILDSQKSELTSTVVNIARKNEILNETKQQLEKLQEKVGKNSKMQLQSLIHTINTDMKLQQDWSQFKLHFDQVHSGFLEKLKKIEPDLTQSNLRLCAYIRLGMTTKEIATLLNISPAGVEKSKYRLRKKFNLDSETSLYDYFIEIN